MDATHLHLIINHIPIVLTPVSLLILIWGWMRDIRPYRILSMGGFILSGIAAYIAFESGEGAEEAVEELMESGESLIHDHEEWAVWSLWGSIILGVISVAGLYVDRANKRLKSGFFAILIIGGIISSGMLFYTAYYGGQIRHTEIRPQQSEVESQPDNAVSTVDIKGDSKQKTKPEEQRLLPMMQKLMVQMNRINTGMYMEDYTLIDTTALNIAHHPKIASEQLKKIKKALGKKIKKFQHYDLNMVHHHADSLSMAARQKDMQEVLDHYNVVQKGCMGCHSDFRPELRKVLHPSKNK